MSYISDQNILSLLKLYEENQCLNQFPTSWGAQAIEAYKTKTESATSLMKEISSYRILSNLNSKFTFKTAINFPVNLKLGVSIRFFFGKREPIKLCTFENNLKS